MSIINRWLAYLDNMQVRYSHSVHDRAVTALETADAERMPAHQFAKTVIYFSDGGYGIAVVPADEFVDLVKLARTLELSYVRLANETELQALFPDCEVGAMPPFGGVADLPVVIDTGLSHEFVAFTLGTHRDIVRMSFADLQRLAKPKLASIAIPQGVLV